MEGCSVASLTTFCSSISQRAISSANEVNTVVEGHNPEEQQASSLSSMAIALTELNRHISQLDASLSSATAISGQLLGILTRFLTSCDGATTVLHKQLMRVQPDSLANLDMDFLTAYRELLEVNSGLFAFFNELLAMDKEDEQDASLDTNQARNLIEQANSTFRLTSTRKSILLDQETPSYDAGARNLPIPEKAQASSSNADPPPYSAEPPASSSQAGPSSGFSRGISSFKNTLKAFASSFQHTPEPYVSAMCQAASRGDVQQVAGFLSQGANINGRNEKGKNALQCAILGNHEDCARLLIASGASTGGSSWSGLPPLFLAASVGSIGVAKLMLSKGASVDEKSIYGQSYFVDVVSANNLDGVRFLLESGASPNMRNISGEAVIATAVRNGRIELVKLLLEFGADITPTDLSGRCLLSIALEKKDFDMAELLLSSGIDPNGTTLTGISLLAEEITNRRLKTAKLLLERGADPNTKDCYSQPVVLIVIKSAKLSPEDKIDIVRDLLDHGAEADVIDGSYKTPAIRHAMETGIAEVVSLMLKHGAKATETMKSGETLLQYAVKQGRSDLVEVLLQHGADPNQTNKQGVSPLMQALVKQDLDMIRKLREGGANTNTDEVKDFAHTLGRADILEALGMESAASLPTYDKATMQ